MFVPTLINVILGFVSPAKLDHVIPPSLLTCHCTVGLGVPLAAEIIVTLLFLHTLVSNGVFVVMVGKVHDVVVQVLFAVLKQISAPPVGVTVIVTLSPTDKPVTW